MHFDAMARCGPIRVNYVSRRLLSWLPLKSGHRILTETIGWIADEHHQLDEGPMPPTTSAAGAASPSATAAAGRASGHSPPGVRATSFDRPGDCDLP